MSALAKTLAKEFADKEYAHGYVNEAINMRIAAQIKALREMRGWTQEELARRAGMKQARISLLEDTDYDAWTLKTLRALAEAFDVAVGVSFVPFSSAILDVVNLSKQRLEVPTRTDDLNEFCEHTFFHNGGQWKSASQRTLAPVVTISREPMKPQVASEAWQDVGISQASEEELLYN